MVTFYSSIGKLSVCHASWGSGMYRGSHIAQCGGREASLARSQWLSGSDGCSQAPQGARAVHEAPPFLLVCSWGISSATGSISVFPNPRRIFLPLISQILRKILASVVSCGSAAWLNHTPCEEEPLLVCSWTSCFFTSLDGLKFLHQKMLNSHSLHPSPCRTQFYRPLPYCTFQAGAVFFLSPFLHRSHFTLLTIFCCLSLYLVQIYCNFLACEMSSACSFQGAVDLYGNTGMFPVSFSGTVKLGGLCD